MSGDQLATEDRRFGQTKFGGKQIKWIRAFKIRQPARFKKFDEKKQQQPQAVSSLF
jgi:hypothetical protein